MYSHQSTAIPTSKLIAIATYQLRPGDPQNSNRGRWTIESPEFGYLGIIGDQEIADATSVGAALEKRLVADGMTVSTIHTIQFPGAFPTYAAYAPNTPTSAYHTLTVSGLRNLADWLEANPQIISTNPRSLISHCLLLGSDEANAAELGRMRDLTTTDQHVTYEDSPHPKMIIEFGPVSYEIYYIPDLIHTARMRSTGRDGDR